MKLDQQSTALKADLKTLDEKLDARIKYFDAQISTVAGKLELVSEEMGR